MDPAEPSDFERLTKFLTAPVRQFGLAIATADDPQVLAEVRARAAAVAVGAGSSLVSVNVVRDGATVPDQLIAAARPGAEVLFVSGLDTLLLDHYGGPVASPEVEQLNWHRDRLASELRAKVIFWLSRPAARALTDAARDLDDIVLTRFHFDRKAEGTQPSLVMIDGSAVASAPSPFALSSVEREAALLDELLASREEDTLGWADAASQRALLAMNAGELVAAERLLARAIATYDQLHEPRGGSHAFLIRAELAARTTGIEDATRLVRDEVLPRAMASGADRAIAVAHMGLANYLYRAGRHSEALRIRRDEVMPLVERLGDRRLLAMAMGDLADYHAAQGELVEAIRIWRVDVLPVLEALGEHDGQVATLTKLAHALRTQTDRDGALAVLRDEALPIARREGEPRRIALTIALIADLQAERGRQDEARHLYQDEVIPLLERGGDPRQLAVARRRLAALARATD